MTVGFRDIEIASERIHGLVHNTPVFQSEQLHRLTGLSLNFKAEHLQKVGAFKARGAVNAICSITKNQLKHGVVTHSSGNHGAALATIPPLMSRNLPFPNSCGTPAASEMTPPDSDIMIAPAA